MRSKEYQKFRDYKYGDCFQFMNEVDEQEQLPGYTIIDKLVIGLSISAYLFIFAFVGLYLGGFIQL